MSDSSLVRQCFRKRNFHVKRFSSKFIVLLLQFVQIKLPFRVRVVHVVHCVVAQSRRKQVYILRVHMKRIPGSCVRLRRWKTMRKNEDCGCRVLHNQVRLRNTFDRFVVWFFASFQFYFLFSLCDRVIVIIIVDKSNDGMFARRRGVLQWRILVVIVHLVAYTYV